MVKVMKCNTVSNFCWNTLLKAVTLEVSQAVYYMKINCLISCELAEKKKREKKTIPLRIKEIMVFFLSPHFSPLPQEEDQSQ